MGEAKLKWPPGEHHQRTMDAWARYLDKAVPSMGEVQARAMAIALWKIGQRIKSR